MIIFYTISGIVLLLIMLYCAYNVGKTLARLHGVTEIEEEAIKIVRNQHRKHMDAMNRYRSYCFDRIDGEIKCPFCWEREQEREATE